MRLKSSRNRLRIFSAQFRVILVTGLGQELHVTDEMSQAELHYRRAFLHEAQVSGIVVAADHPVESRTEDIEQDLGAACFVNSEEGVLRRPEAPGPELVAVVLVSGFVNAEVRLEGKQSQEFVVDGRQSRGNPRSHDLRQGPPTQALAEDFVHKRFDSGVGGVTASFEKADESTQSRTGDAAGG